MASCKINIYGYNFSKGEKSARNKLSHWPVWLFAEKFNPHHNQDQLLLLDVIICPPEIELGNFCLLGNV